MNDLEIKNEIKSDESDSSDYASDNESEVNNLFIKSEQVAEKEIGKKKYLLHISGTLDSTPNIAVTVSHTTCEVYNLSNNQLAKITTLSEHSDTIIDCKFSEENNNLLFTGSNDGSIKLWDIRTPEKSVVNFTDTTIQNGEKNKSIGCFDVSHNERLIAAGTDLYKGDAYILFWDIRGKNLLGGYWESHTDDITQVKFHPSNMNKLISGSTDGLINLYDLSENSEDDAYKDSLNTESSIEKLQWYTEIGQDAISCITHTSDLQLWKLDDAAPYKHFRKGDIANEIMREFDNTYIANCHSAKNSLLVLAGSNKGYLRGLQISNGNIQPALSFPQNHQLVRSSWFNENTNLLCTAGEKGTLSIWKVPLLKSEVNFIKKEKF